MKSSDAKRIRLGINLARMHASRTSLSLPLEALTDPLVNRAYHCTIDRFWKVLPKRVSPPLPPVPPRKKVLPYDQYTT